MGITADHAHRTLHSPPAHSYINTQIVYLASQKDGCGFEKDMKDDQVHWVKMMVLRVQSSPGTMCACAKAAQPREYARIQV